ncbi:hypothetical protein [Mesorhizobium escarrei]|uniref:hypothetical protein n=1 Tax=Mesorhizobium escarrei TaxID=666018 RepID=UPI0020A75265|nr:hypothetical protein [Mesorhizobium escarrei]
MSRLAAGLAAHIVALQQGSVLQLNHAGNDGVSRCLGPVRAELRRLSIKVGVKLPVSPNLGTQQQRWSPGQRHRAPVSRQVQVKKMLHNHLK